jgi:hypothetical protein
LALDEIAVESSIKDGGDVAGKFLMDDELLRRIRFFPNKGSYEGAWFAVTN